MLHRGAPNFGSRMKLNEVGRLRRSRGEQSIFSMTGCSKLLQVNQAQAAQLAAVVASLQSPRAATGATPRSRRRRFGMSSSQCHATARAMGAASRAGAGVFVLAQAGVRT